MSTLRKSIGPLPLIAMGAAGIIGTSWIHTNAELAAEREEAPAGDPSP